VIMASADTNATTARGCEFAIGRIVLAPSEATLEGVYSRTPYRLNQNEIILLFAWGVMATGPSGGMLNQAGSSWCSTLGLGST
jgi:hypothetical protein